MSLEGVCAPETAHPQRQRCVSHGLERPAGFWESPGNVEGRAREWAVQQEL